jgi:recombination protein RecA
MDDREKIFEACIKEIEKEYGKGAVVIGKDSLASLIPRIPSGSIGLDVALSGGYAKGRIIEIYGPESSGKTTLALHAIVECQKLGGKCAFIDMEHALDAQYAGDVGVDMEKLAVSQPNSAEQALNIIERLTRSGTVDLIVLDSVSALVPEKEIEGEIGNQQVGKQAQLMSQTMRKLASVCHTTGTSVIFINQIRMKIGVMFGSPETTSGGNALKFFASQRLDIRKKGVVTTGEVKTGQTAKVTVKKSKVGPPFREAEFNIIFGSGIDWANDLLAAAVSKDLVEKSGAWYTINKERMQGANKACKYLQDNPEVVKELRDKILV